MAKLEHTGFHNFVGVFANDSAALASIRAAYWDTTHNGSGNPQAGMCYHNTTEGKPRFWDGSAWQYFGDTAFAGRVREFLLTSDQLDDTDGINAAGLVTFQSLPVSGDTIVLTDGTTTRTYGADSGGDVQFTIGVDIATTMANLATAINGDGSSIWSASYKTAYPEIDADGVVVLVEDANSGTAPRVYGVWSTQADCEYVNFTGASDYSSKTLATLPASDPTTSNFGFRRTVANLLDGEIHANAEDIYLFVWDDSATTWQQMTGAGSHNHDDRYYTETELGSTTASSEGASLIGTDTKTGLSSATNVETALTFLDGQSIKKNFTNAGNPNGVVSAVAIGDICFDSSNVLFYMASATGTDNWVLIG